MIRTAEIYEFVLKEVQSPQGLGTLMSNFAFLMYEDGTFNHENKILQLWKDQYSDVSEDDIGIHNDLKVKFILVNLVSKT